MKKFEAAIFDVICLRTQDVIVTSSDTSEENIHHNDNQSEFSGNS